MLRKSLAATLGIALVPLAGAFDIVFDYTYDSGGFFANADRRAVLEAAGSYFESVISDDLLAITSSGTNAFTARFTAPDSGTTVSIPDFSVPANTLIIFAGARQLGSSTLGSAGPGGFQISGSGAFINDAISRGEGDGTQSAVRGAGAVDFAPWGGQVVFDIDNNWYVDTDVSTAEPFSGDDFYSVALHEVAHILGYGTADTWFNQINGSNEFTGATSVAVFGGNVPLQPGGGHWLDGTDGSLDGIFVEAAMDPTLRVGTRKEFTPLDLAALADIGWEVTAIPLPMSALLMLPALVGLSGAARRRA